MEESGVSSALRFASNGDVQRNPRTRIRRKGYYSEIFPTNHSEKEEKTIQGYETDPGEQIA